MPTKPKLPGKGVKVGPILTALAQKQIVLDGTSLAKIGKILVKAVVEEAKKDFAKRGKSGLADTKGLPNSKGTHIRPSFFKSFSAKVTGARSIEIVSTWPWIEGLIEGRPAHKMDKHTMANPKMRVVKTRADGSVYTAGRVIPMLQTSGKVLFRTVPLTTATAWIHPSIAKHTFVNRGLVIGRKRLIDQGMMLEIILDQIKRTTK